jgi:hypothetical protein
MSFRGAYSFGGIEKCKKTKQYQKNCYNTEICVSIVPQMMMCHVSENNSFHKD